MKKRYFTLALFQLLLIVLAAILRRYSWAEIDSQAEDGMGAYSLTMKFSMYMLFAWLATIFISMVFAIKDTKNRAMIILFLVLLLPFFEFWGWFFYSF
ncbi:hypothetical protein [Glaciimonas soli]|uniref:Uncharacterized protein n=1 Tax=Glaciimonas soli TaxID=2590999 RepID=A0A843YS15_9BURK|nr:hypothetical protein [Glaciimonas soli]MQR02355.1 hypothetical protein [Glaciimonas soli]